MKKIYINNLDTEKRNYIIKLNSKLMKQLQEDLYDAQMYQQLDCFECMLDKTGQDALKYHDHYSSFYYTLKDWRKFIEGLDKEYLSTETLDIYDKIIDKIKELDEMDPYSDEYYNLDAELEEESKIVLKDVEDLLHSYEDYPSEDDAIQYADEMERLNDYYIEEREDGTSDNVIRLDIAYTECFI